MTLRPENERLLTELELYVVATEENRAQFDCAPFGLELAPDGRINPVRCDAAQFLHLLSSLDAATFSRQGVPMPRSAFSIYTFSDPDDPTVVAVDTVTDDLVLTDADHVKRYEELFNRLREAAEPAQESLEMLITYAQGVRV